MGFSSFFRSIAHAITKPLQNLANAIPGGNIIVPAALSAINPGLGAAYVGASNYDKSGSFGKSLASALGTYAGGKIATNYLPDMGTIGGNIGSAANSVFGSGSSNAIGSALANTGANAASGGFVSNLFSTPVASLAGNAISGNLASSLAGVSPQTGNVGASGPAPFKPVRQKEQNLPVSLSAFGGLTPGQQSSNIANQGVYGTGLGPQESSYFLNLINRRLIDQSGKVASDTSSISPIENSYLSQLGLGGWTNPNSLLESISKYHA